MNTPRYTSTAFPFRRGAAALAMIVLLIGGCGDEDDSASTSPGVPTAQEEATTSPESRGLDRAVNIGGGRRLYVNCMGSGSPTVVMEAGDADTGDYYSSLASTVGETTRACFYDRANLGQSGPARGPRGLRDLVGDLERLLEAARIPGPYV